MVLVLTFTIIAAVIVIIVIAFIVIIFCRHQSLYQSILPK